jgi:hypothetical protein
MRFGVVAAVEIWMLIFSLATPHGLEGSNVSEERTVSIFSLEDGKRAEGRCSMFLRNAGVCLQVKLQAKRLTSAFHPMFYIVFYLLI